MSTYRRLVAVTAVAVLGLAACADDEAPETMAPEAMTEETAAAVAPPPAMLEIAGAEEWSGPLSAAAVDLTVAVRDQRGWDILWQLVGQPQPGPLPSGAMAVGVFVGSRGSAGYAVTLAEVASDDDGVSVAYREVPPVADPPPPGIAAPYIVRLLPLTTGPVTFSGS